MSMKHEYKINQEVVIAGNESGHEFAIGATVKIIHLLDKGWYQCADDHCSMPVPDHDLSPYPPVKSVDGWAVVNEWGDILLHTTAISKEQSINRYMNLGKDTLPNGYRCIPVTITAKKVDYEKHKQEKIKMENSSNKILRENE